MSGMSGAGRTRSQRLGAVTDPGVPGNADLVDRVRLRLVATACEATPTGVAQALRDEGLVLGDAAVLALVEDVRRDLVGAGPLETYLRLPGVTDVLVTGPSDVWIDRGMGLERVPVSFRGEDEVRRLAQRLAASAGRRLDGAMPYVDARLGDGTRLHAVLPPLAVDGTVISLRVPRQRYFGLADLIDAGTVDEQGAQWLAAIVQARLAFLVSGGTGSGKTTVLSCLLGLVPSDERILLVEDSAELRPDHPHVVRLQARLANVEGAGAVTMRDLVRQSLRMRPDRLVVGEVRGAEVVDLLTAMNTGHEGGCGTVHANAAQDVPARLEALGLMAGLDRAALHALMAAGVDVVIHLRRDAQGCRVVDGIYVLQVAQSGLVTGTPAMVRSEGRLQSAAGAQALATRIERAGLAVP